MGGICAEPPRVLPSLIRKLGKYMHTIYYLPLILTFRGGTRSQENLFSVFRRIMWCVIQADRACGSSPQGQTDSNFLVYFYVTFVHLWMYVRSVGKSDLMDIKPSASRCGAPIDNKAVV
jgi:hypothetical protein